MNHSTKRRAVHLQNQSDQNVVSAGFRTCVESLHTILSTNSVSKDATKSFKQISFSSEIKEDTERQSITAIPCTLGPQRFVQTSY